MLKVDRMYFILGWVLLAQFVWRIIVPAHEWPSPTVTYLSMIFDFAVLAGLVGARAQVNLAGRVGPNLLFWLALAAGIGLFVIRMTGQSAWSSGHLVNTLADR